MPEKVIYLPFRAIDLARDVLAVRVILLWRIEGTNLMHIH